jgi:hypothetical protein
VAPVHQAKDASNQAPSLLRRQAPHCLAKNLKMKKYLKRKRKMKKRVTKKEAKRVKQDLHHYFKKA